MIVAGDVGSLADGMDKLGPLMRTQQEYQEGNIIFSSRHGCSSSSGASLLDFGTAQAGGDCRPRDVELWAEFLSVLTT